eukprot:ANDGO_01809.mRNA.1 regulator of chromosome condensation
MVVDPSRDPMRLIRNKRLQLVSSLESNTLVEFTEHPSLVTRFAVQITAAPPSPLMYIERIAQILKEEFSSKLVDSYIHLSSNELFSVTVFPELYLSRSDAYRLTQYVQLRLLIDEPSTPWVEIVSASLFSEDAQIPVYLSSVFGSRLTLSAVSPFMVSQLTVQMTSVSSSSSSSSSSLSTSAVGSNVSDNAARSELFPNSLPLSSVLSVNSQEYSSSHGEGTGGDAIVAQFPGNSPVHLVKTPSFCAVDLSSASAASTNCPREILLSEHPIDHMMVFARTCLYLSDSDVDILRKESRVCQLAATLDSKAVTLWNRSETLPKETTSIVAVGSSSQESPYSLTTFTGSVFLERMSRELNTLAALQGTNGNNSTTAHADSNEGAARRSSAASAENMGADEFVHLDKLKTPNLSIVEIHAGSDFLVMRDIVGAVYTVGSPASGRLGRPVSAPNPSADVLSRVLAVANPVIQVVGGHSHTLVLTDQGELWGWGANYQGQLATAVVKEHQQGSARIMLPELPFAAVPQRIQLPAFPVHAIAAGESFCAAIAGPRREVFAWGGSWGHQPRMIPKLEKVRWVSCGGSTDSPFVVACQDLHPRGDLLHVYGPPFGCVGPNAQALKIDLESSGSVFLSASCGVSRGIAFFVVHTADGLIFVIKAKSLKEGGDPFEVIEVPFFEAAQIRVSHLSCCNTFAAAVSDDGDVYVWGDFLGSPSPSPSITPRHSMPNMHAQSEADMSHTTANFGLGSHNHGSSSSSSSVSTPQSAGANAKAPTSHAQGQHTPNSAPVRSPSYHTSFGTSTTSTHTDQCDISLFEPAPVKFSSFEGKHVRKAYVIDSSEFGRSMIALCERNPSSRSKLIRRFVSDERLYNSRLRRLCDQVWASTGKYLSNIVPNHTLLLLSLQEWCHQFYLFPRFSSVFSRFSRKIAVAHRDFVLARNDLKSFIASHSAIHRMAFYEHFFYQLLKVTPVDHPDRHACKEVLDFVSSYCKFLYSSMDRYSGRHNDVGLADGWGTWHSHRGDVFEGFFSNHFPYRFGMFCDASSNTQRPGNEFTDRPSVPSAGGMKSASAAGATTLKTLLAQAMVTSSKDVVPSGMGGASARSLSTGGSDGGEYIGGFWKGLRDGYGVYTSRVTGERYIGMWSHGLPHGRGVWLTASGEILLSYFDQARIASCRPDALSECMVAQSNAGWNGGLVVPLSSPASPTPTSPTPTPASPTSPVSSGMQGISSPLLPGDLTLLTTVQASFPPASSLSLLRSMPDGEVCLMVFSASPFVLSGRFSQKGSILDPVKKRGEVVVGDGSSVFRLFGESEDFSLNSTVQKIVHGLLTPSHDLLERFSYFSSAVSHFKRSEPHSTLAAECKSALKRIDDSGSVMNCSCRLCGESIDIERDAQGDSQQYLTLMKRGTLLHIRCLFAVLKSLSNSKSHVHVDDFLAAVRQMSVCGPESRMPDEAIYEFWIQAMSDPLIWACRFAETCAREYRLKLHDLSPSPVALRLAVLDPIQVENMYEQFCGKERMDYSRYGQFCFAQALASQYARFEWCGREAFLLYERRYAHQDALCNAAIKRLTTSLPTDFGVRKEFSLQTSPDVVPYLAAIRFFSNLFFTNLSPFDLLDVLVIGKYWINACWLIHFENSGEAVKAAGGDETRPLYWYCLVRAQIPNLYSKMMYLSQFYAARQLSNVLPPERTGVYDMVLADMEGCCQFLLQQE